MLNQNSGRNLFLPYDITTLLGNGIDLPTGLPMRSRKYNGGSAHARAGRGINSKKFEEKKLYKLEISIPFEIQFGFSFYKIKKLNWNITAKSSG